MFKIKRRDSDDGKLPLLTNILTKNVQTDKHKMRNTRGIEKFSTFDSIIRSTNRRFDSQSPRRGNRKHKISRSRNRSKLSNNAVSTMRTQPMPFIIKRESKKTIKNNVDK
mmetsp:Transcript_31483/g.27855  ORF Transcript_31483/g.27855 Transcript_31483/m.27855 type:complete len:110 (-) Transcript_31483:93-422(-)